MKKCLLFECSICGKRYEREIACIECEKRGMERVLVKVGEIASIGAGFGWFDGDRRWVINPEVKRNPQHGNCFAHCCTMAFYYVVTAIDKDPEDDHRLRYHLFTNAMTEKQGYASGYTFAIHHYTPRKIKNPPEFVVLDSKKLIGKKAEYLI